MDKTNGEKKKKKGVWFWIFLPLWCLALIGAGAYKLKGFYEYMEEYQALSETTQHTVFLAGVMESLNTHDAKKVVEMADPVEFGPYEGEEEFVRYMEKRLEGQTIEYYIKSGDYSEERPVYVLTANSLPFGILRLKKQAETVEYGLPIWEVAGMELFAPKVSLYGVKVPDYATVTINGRPMREDLIEKTESKGSASGYFEPYVWIPTYTLYNLGKFYAEPIVVATDENGDALEPVTYLEDVYYYIEPTRTAGQEVLESVEEYAIEAATTYTMYQSNDTPSNGLDWYFAKDAKWLGVIKMDTKRDQYAAHDTPEIRDVQTHECYVYQEDAVSIRVSLEQEIHYTEPDEKTQIVHKNLRICLVRINDAWKVTCIVELEA